MIHIINCIEFKIVMHTISPYQIIPPLFIGGIILFIGLYNFVIYMILKKSRAHLTFSFACIFMALYSISPLLLVISDPAGIAVPVTRIRIMAMAAALPALILYLSDAICLVSIATVRLYSALYAFILIAVAVDCAGYGQLVPVLPVELFPSLHPIPQSGLLTMVLGIYIIITLLFLVARSITRSRHGIGVKMPWVSISLSIFLAASILDLLIIRHFPHSVPVLDYAFLFIAAAAHPENAGIVRDRTDMSDALTGMANSFISVFESAKDAMVIIQKGRIIACNTSAFSVFQMDRRQIIGKPLHRLAPKQQPDGSLSKATIKYMLDRSLAGNSQFYECQLLRGDSSLFIAEISFSRIEGQEIESVLAFVRDINSRRLMVDELQKNKERLEVSLETAKMGIFDWNIPENRAYCNDLYFSIFGLPPEDNILSEEEWLKLIHPDDRGIIQKTQFHAFSDHSPYDVRYRIVRPDGTTRWIHSTATIFFDNHDRPFRMLGTITDINDEVWAFEELHRYHEHLEELVHERTSDIRNTIIRLEQEISERKQAETKLGASEKRFRELADMLPVIVFEVGVDGNFTYINKTGLVMTGYTLDDIGSGLTPQNFVISEEQSTIFSDIATIKSGDMVPPRKYWAMKKNGSIYPTIVYTLPIWEGNTVAGIRGVVVDLSELKKEENLRKVSERRYRELVDQLPDIIFEMDTDGTITFGNRTAATITGYSIDDIRSGINARDIVIPEEHAKMVENLEKIISSETIATYEYTAIKKDGTRFPIIIHSAPILDEDDRTVGIRGVLIDITEQKKSVEMLKASERKFREMANLLPVIVFETDMEGNISYVNDITYSITGYGREEFDAGINISRFFSKGDYRRLNYDTMDLLSTGTIPPTEYDIIRKDGTAIPVLISSSLIRFTGERGAGFRGVITDITEMKEIQRQIIDIMNTAKNANHAKSIFLANISHELKTPLNSILGYCRMMEMQRVGDLNAKQLEYIACVKESGEHLLNIINELLDISKIQAGKMEFDMNRVDLKEVLLSTVNAMMSLAAEKSLILEKDIHEDLGAVRGDLTRLREVVYNLLSNAVKFTSPGKRIGIRALSAEKCARIIVWDEGPGIPADSHEKIFEPFEQASIDTAVKNQGAGLGLAISKKIIEFHNGTIEVESDIGKGSVFTVTLPLQEL